MNPCLDLVGFANGELELEREAAFREHLRTCAACQHGLVEVMQLDAQLSTLTAIRDQQRTAASAPRKGPRWQRAWIRIGAIGVAAAIAAGGAGTAIVASRGPASSTAPAVAVAPSDGFAGRRTRPFEIRLAYPGAADHRPPRDAVRGAAAPEDPAERVAYAALDALDARGDRHGLAIARAWNGEKLTDVVVQLAALAPTPSIRSDRAALAMLTTTADNAEPVLAELEALVGSSDLAASRAARWNRALLLAQLELPLSAARAFEAIAGDGEPGWADEARARAAPLARRGEDFQRTWQRAYQAGEALIARGEPVPSELIQLRPGLLRAYFYNAVRTAPSRERVAALAPMAAELDRIAGRAPQVLSDYVQRIARVDFARRAPLAAAYAALLRHETVPADQAAQLVAETSAPELADIAMGAMVEREVVARHAAWFRAAATRSGDPWHAIVLARAEAEAALAASDWLGAEAILRGAEARCTPDVVYQCLTLQRRLGKLYAEIHRVRDARAVLQTAVRDARGAGEWGRYRALLWQLADTERFHAATATVRAYAGELLLMRNPGTDCENVGPAHDALAGAALLDLDGPTARRELMRALDCGSPDLRAVNHLADIARLDPQPGDLVQVQDMLRGVRAAGVLTAAEQVLADEIEGRVVIEHDRAAGAALLRKAIARADELPREVIADKARADAFAVLAFDAGQAGELAQAFGAIAGALGLAPPPACAVAMTAEVGRAVVVVRSADGQDRGEYAPRWRSSTGAPEVSGELARGLAGCARVRVLAPAALQGRPRVLPDDVAWSYATPAHGRLAAPPGSPPAPRALIVGGVTPPAYLRLQPLSAPPPSAVAATVLSGLEATPARVIAAMADATEIQFHTHALMDVGVSDASHLVLAPETGGRYALTAEAIRGTRLRGHPVVVLAACHAAQGARYQHAPWSLPDAFLTVGARAVLAAATEIPDVESGEFFARVLARVRGGADPSVALRDQRVAAGARAPSWIGDVIVFE